MKLVVVLLVSLMGVAYAEHVKRQFGEILLVAEPILSKLLLDKLGLDKLIGRFIGDIGGFIHGKSGHIPLDGTQLVLDYEIHRCTFHVGRKRLFGSHFGEQCKADVCENKITKTCKSCTKGHPADALKCALTAEVNAIQTLAKQAAAQQAG